LKGDFRISEWTVQPQINSLRKGDEVYHLEPKVMQVLVELASAPNETLTRDHLIETIWPGTFVSDHVLTRCISELRRVLNEDARAPKFIQNVPKVGYRLIAPVEPEDGSTSATSGTTALFGNAQHMPPYIGATGVGTAVQSPPVPASQAQSARASAPAPNRRIRNVAVVAAILILAISAATFLWMSRAGHSRGERAFRIIPFTSFPGSETQPAFSPDGNQIAFVWNDGGGSLHIFVKQIDNETPLRLTNTSNTKDLSPAWSPDQKSIAFIRQTNSGNAIFIVPSIGGPEREIHKLAGAIDWDDPGLSWSPDGKRLIFPDAKSEQQPSAIYSLALDTLEAHPITSPPNAWDGDFNPAFSPDGAKIAFVRGTDAAVRNIYVVDANGGAPEQLTSEGRLVLGITWTNDSSKILFSSNRGSAISLWQVSANGGQPESVGMLGFAIHPAISPKGNRLAYSEGSANWSTIRLALKSATTAEVAGTLLESTEQESAPEFSPDDRRIAFQSWRSGAQEIWQCAADGSGPVKVTSFEGAVTGSPSWSPSGSEIAFDSRIQGWSHIFVMNAAGGSPRAVTSGEYNDIIPSWSQDSKWIYFGSKRSGIWQIWKVNVGSGALAQVTKNGGFVASESPDGKWLYYTRYNVPGLWRMPLTGNKRDEVKALPGPPENSWGYWSFANGGIYFLDVQNSKAVIAFAKLGSAETTAVYTLPRLPTPYSGITVSHDGRWLLYTDEAERGYNIKLIEDFEQVLGR
jgi:Tol biopolymer transport system component/DNA-binding winged helix-turn-helix (wHTH) protein